MSSISIETKKASELGTLDKVKNSDMLIVNDATGMKRVSVETFKNEWGVSPTLVVTAPEGSTIRVSDGVTTLSEVGGTVTFNLPNYGDWTITATLSGQTASRTINVDTVKLYKETMAYFEATINVVYPVGSTLTCTCGETVLTATTTTGNYVFTVDKIGDWVVKATQGDDVDSKTVQITEDGQSASIELSFVTIYGIRRTVSSTSTAWTRTDAGVGKTATASVGTNRGASDFDNCYPWSQMVRETLSTGDVMVKIPEFYFQRFVDNGVENIRIADKPTSGFVKHPGSGKYIGAYKISGNNKSVSGASPTVNQTRATMRANARAKGTGWSLIDGAVWSAVIMLYLVEFADNNSQAKIGRGYCDKTSNGSAITVGSCDNVPNLTGRPSGTDGLTDVVYRGIEGFWGNIWEWVDGVNWNDGTYYVCTNPANFADDTASYYTALSYRGATNWNTSYITTEGMDDSNPWAMFPSVAGGGSESTGISDGVWSSTGWRVCKRGGSWSNGSIGGIFASSLDNASSYADTYIGSRLLYNPS